MRLQNFKQNDMTHPPHTSLFRSVLSFVSVLEPSSVSSTILPPKKPKMGFSILGSKLLKPFTTKSSREEEDINSNLNPITEGTSKTKVCNSEFKNVETSGEETTDFSESTTSTVFTAEKEMEEDAEDAGIGIQESAGAQEGGNSHAEKRVRSAGKVPIAPTSGKSKPFLTPLYTSPRLVNLKSIAPLPGSVLEQLGIPPTPTPKPKTNPRPLFKKSKPLESEPKSSSNKESDSTTSDPTNTSISLPYTARDRNRDLLTVTSISNLINPANPRRKKKSLTICLSNCRYEIVRITSEKFGFTEVTEDQPWNIFWTDSSVSLERVVSMRRYQLVNHFPGMYEICRKDLLARNLNRMRRKFPQDYDIFPMTWCLPTDRNELALYAQNRRGKTYICKPEQGCQGRGIFLVRNVKELLKPYERIICQVYIPRPFLIDHFKFDLRIYVLITSCDPLRIWVYDEGLARFATAKYKMPTASNTEISYMHLTNYAVNKFSVGFVSDSEEFGSKRKLSTVYQWLKERSYNVEKLKNEIDDIIIKTIISAHPIMKHHYKSCFPHHYACSACFELLGFDILLDCKLKPHVIEVNHSPSLHLDSNLDREVKEELLWDTFSMFNLKRLDKKKIENEDRQRVQLRLANKVAEMKVRSGEKGDSFFVRPTDKVGRSDSAKDNAFLAKNPDKEKKDEQFMWEVENCGCYRLVYPLSDSWKYNRFMDQSNSGTKYQETVSFQAKSNIPPRHIPAVRPKVQKLKPKKKPRVLKPGSKEESVPKKKVKRKGLATPSIDSSVAGSYHQAIKVNSSLFYDLDSSPAGLPIVTKEENDRNKRLKKRDQLVKSLGVDHQVYNLLSQVGTLKASEHEEFQRKHRLSLGTLLSSSNLLK